MTATASAQQLKIEMIISYVATLQQEPMLIEALKHRDRKSTFEGLIWEHGLMLKSYDQVEAVVSRSRTTLLAISSTAMRNGLRTNARRKREQELQEELRGLSVPPTIQELLFLPKFHPFSSLLLKEIHLQTNHGSAPQMTISVQRKFWIPRVRTLAKKIQRECLRCRILKAKCIRQPEAPLPFYRSLTTRPFATVGIDFTKNFQPIPNVSKLPCILLVTCSYYRCCLLVPVQGQDFEAVIFAYDYLKNLRSIEPDLIVTDHAGAFQKGYKILKNRGEVFDHKANLSRSPWWGGFFERMVKLVKDHIARAFDDFTFENWNQFQLTVSFLERLINSRPILETYSERGDADMTLVPNQFINVPAKESFSSTLSDFFDVSLSSSSTFQDLVDRQKALLVFKRKIFYLFQHLYHAELRKFHRTSFFSPKETHQLKIGDAVLISPEFDFKKGSASRRLLWIRGRVTSVMRTARDNVIRAATIEETLPNGTRKVHGPLPIQRIAPLEVQDRKPEMKEKEKTSSSIEA
jgi:hypothetical protein